MNRFGMGEGNVRTSLYGLMCTDAGAHSQKAHVRQQEWEPWTKEGDHQQSRGWDVLPVWQLYVSLKGMHRLNYLLAWGKSNCGF